VRSNKDGSLGKKKMKSDHVRRPSIKTALTDGMVKLQKIETLGCGLQKLKLWRSN
jgi:hypothetical protein